MKLWTSRVRQSCLPPPSRRRRPPGKFQSDGWFGSPPGAAGCAVEFTKFWAPLASDFMCRVERARESCSYCKELSIFFLVVSSHDIIVGWIMLQLISTTSIQRRASNKCWVVTFRSKAVKDAALNEHTITIASCSVLVGDCENRFQSLKSTSFLMKYLIPL